MTNEFYNFNKFWKYGMGCTVILGFVAYNYGYLSALSPKKEAKQGTGCFSKLKTKAQKTLNRIVLIASAFYKVFSLFDDARFIYKSDIYDEAYIYLLIFFTMIQPVYSILSVLTMRDFESITGLTSSIKNRLLYIPL